MKRVLVKSFAVLFVLLYVVSCINVPVIEKPVVVPPTVEGGTPGSDFDADKENFYSNENFNN